MTKLHLLEAPMHPRTAVRDYEADVLDLLSRKADVVGLTASGQTRHKALLRTSRQSGYQLVHPSTEGGGTAEAVLLIKADHELVKSWWVPALPGEAGTPGRGGRPAYGDRGWAFAKIKVDGNTVVVGQASFVTNGNDPEDASRSSKNSKVLRKGLSAVKKETRGNTVGFLLGDAYFPEDKASDDAGVVSVWKGRKVPEGPNASVSVLDTNSRSAFTRIRRWPQGNSDHPPLSVWVEIAAKDEPKPKGAPKSAPIEDIPVAVPDQFAAEVEQEEAQAQAEQAPAQQPAKRAAKKATAKRATKKTAAKRTARKQSVSA